MKVQNKMARLDALRRNARRLPKAAYWLLTPWRMPERLRFLRERSLNEAKAQALEDLIESEHSHLESLRLGGVVDARREFDLCNDAEVIEVAGLPREYVLWPLVGALEVTDRRSAARFCVDLLRSRADLYARFPHALSATGDSDFAIWLQSEEGRASSGLDVHAVSHVVALFSEDFAARARQAFLVAENIKLALPHGLTPVGRYGLFRWFMQHGCQASGLELEEVWWLFLQAAESPRMELFRAYLFAPQWQARFPDALTVFGWERFSRWFVRTYGADQVWVAPDGLPQWHEPAMQIRIAYLARDEWRARHPNALSEVQAARVFLDGLASGEAVDLSGMAKKWCRDLDIHALAPRITETGANIIGHFCYPSGLRVSVESIVEALGRAGVPTTLRDLRTDVRDDPNHIRFDGQEVHDISIIHTQPEPLFALTYEKADLASRSPRTYRIAYWYWEFDSIPDAWVECANQVDEVWTATEFVARGLRARLSVPVRTLFPGVRLTPFEVRKRAYFGLPADRYTFLFTFHMMSVMERKNPLGLIRAFKMAFGESENVSLVLKTSFGDRYPEQLEELRAAASAANILLIDQVFSPDEVLSLMQACDVYVSLHRSEGLGLTMAEAMLMGKPVIATRFSGNVDFMNDDNSLLVPCELVKLGRPIPPYDAELEWAEPSIEEAARRMRQAYDNQAWARALGARAKTSAQANLSLETAGRKIKERLEEIQAILRVR